MRLLDITGRITNDMWSYGPPLPPVQIEPVATLQDIGWSGHSLGLNTLSGTYMETAAHVFADREQLSDVDPARFVLNAAVLQLPDKEPLEPITADELVSEARSAPPLQGKALLIATGWDTRWGHPEFVTHCPYFTEDAMQWVIDQDASLLGLDIPCAQDPRNDDGTLVRQFFAKDRLLLAPLVNLRKAGRRPYTLVSLPLNIKGVCGTPCRAILMEQE